MKRMFSLSILVLLFVTMVIMPLRIQPVKAASTIYIRSDGSIDPPDAPILTSDNVTYILISNLSVDPEVIGIAIMRSDIVFDGNGYAIQGNGTQGHLPFGIGLLGVDNVTIRNTHFQSLGHGIWLNSSSNNRISGNEMIGNNGGIWFDYSSSNTIDGNIITDNVGGIILSHYSSYNDISGNVIRYNQGPGIGAERSSNYNSIRGNDIAYTGTDGIYIILSSHDFSIIGNNITYNNNGIWLDGAYSQNVTAYHNNLIGNVRAQVVAQDIVNVWDSGYPSGGNYWSDYAGLDTDGDGIGDSPYIIDTNNRDNYPLIRLYTPMTGDINQDRAVDIFDCTLVALAFNSKPGDPNWNSVADINNDLLVDIFDLVVVALNFGRIG